MEPGKQNVSVSMAYMCMIIVRMEGSHEFSTPDFIHSNLEVGGKIENFFWDAFLGAGEGNLREKLVICLSGFVWLTLLSG